MIDMSCLNCAATISVEDDSLEAQGVFNVFCDGDCENEYASKQ